MAVTVQPGRLLESIERYARIGATGGGGVTRLTLSDEDQRARTQLATHAAEAGLAMRVDDFGNMIGFRPGDESLPPIQLGSHLDTVRLGGRLDGALGVLGGLEVICALNDAGITTRHPIELVNWTNEEGVRFEPAMMGSGVTYGVFEREWACERADRDGVRLGDELARIGFLGDATHRLRPGAAYLELHIEQGPVLDDENLSVGIVEGILGITWIDVRISGQADHAGPSPMRLRRDALSVAAEIISSVERLALEAGPPAVGTVGRIDVQPNLINVVPGDVRLSVDLRHQKPEALEALVAQLTNMVIDIANRRNVEIDLNRFWTSAPTRFDQRVVSTIARVAERRNVPSRKLWSGAGHDAKYAADAGPAGMIFVRSRDGLSHCEEEASDADDIIAGVATLLDTVIALDASLDTPDQNE